MKKILIFMLLVIFLVACSPAPQPERVVERVIVQCWDGSTAESLDKCPVKEEPKSLAVEPQLSVETTPTEPVTVPTSGKTIMQELLEKSPDLYWFSDGQYGAIVAGTKRSTGEYDQYWNFIFRLMYWDTQSKVVYVLAPYHVSESWWLKQQGKEPEQRTVGSTKYLPAFFKLELTGDEEVDKVKIPIEFNKYWFDAKATELIRIIKPFYIKSPIDIMLEYIQETPIKIDKTAQMLPWGGGNVASKLAIHYINKKNPNQTIVFRFGEKYSIPLTIDELANDGSFIRRTTYDFDTTYFKQGKTNVPVSDKLVELPKDSIIITVKQFDKWLEEIEN